MKFKLIESFEDNKVTGYPWKSFIKNIEETTNFLVDSAYRRNPSKWIELIDKNTKQIYDAEVTKYSDGTYELMLYNINKQFNESFSNESLNEEIFEFLEELGGYTDYRGRIEAVAEEFDISFDEAEEFVNEWILTADDEYEFDECLNESTLEEDTVKTSDGKWTNKGEEGTHGKFKTKKEADAQRKAMFANGYKG